MTKKKSHPQVGGAVEEPQNPVETVGDVRSVLLVLQILELLALRKACGVTELATSLGATKARVHRHLRTLLGAGYAGQESGGDHYTAGPRLTALGYAMSPDKALIAISKPILRRLRDESGHTAILAKVAGDTISIVDAYQGTGLFGIFVALGQSIPLHAVAAGKIALAMGGEPFQEKLRSSASLTRYTDSTITDPETLELELARIREQGWATSPEECVTGVNAISAPIFGANGELIATISVVDSLQFIARLPSRQLVNVVTQAAAQISSIVTLTNEV